MPALAQSPRAGNLRRASWGPPIRGLNVQAVPLAVGDDEATVLQNVLTDETPGTIQTRPGNVLNGIIKGTVYDGSALPNASTPVWVKTVGGAGGYTETVASGLLTLNTLSTQTVAYSRTAGLSANATGNMLHFKVIGNDVTPDSVETMNIAEIYDGTRQAGVRWFEGASAISLYTTDGVTTNHVFYFPPLSGTIVNSLTGEYHLTLKGATANLYVNGVLKLTIAALANAGAATVRWGHFGKSGPGGGTIDYQTAWDYIEYWGGDSLTAEGNAPVRTLYEYRKADGTYRLVAMSADSMFISTGDGNFGTAVKSGLNSNFESSLATYKDLLWHTNGTDNIFTWNGTTATDVIGGNLASRGRYIIAHHGRLWHASSSGDPSSVFFSELDLAAHADPGDALNWPAVNQFYVGRDDGDKITGMKVYNDALVFFKRNAIWILYGYTPVPGEASLRRISANIGCPNYRTAGEWNGNLVFLASDGVLRMITPAWQVTKLPNGRSDAVRALTESIQQTQAVERGYSRTTQADWDAGTKTNIDTTTTPGAIQISKDTAATLINRTGTGSFTASLNNTGNTTCTAQILTNNASTTKLITSVTIGMRYQGYLSEIMMMADIRSNVGDQPGAIISTGGSGGISASAVVVNSPVVQQITFTFATPVSVAAGASVWFTVTPFNRMVSSDTLYSTLSFEGVTTNKVRQLVSGSWDNTLISYAHQPLIVNQQLTYLSPGTWESPAIDTGGFLSQWDTLSTDQRTPASTILAWQYKTATTSAGLATATYQSITPGSQIISALANRYIQLKVTLTTTDVSVTPLVDGLTLRWFESGLPSMPPGSAVFNGRYYLSVAALGSTTNNKVIVLDWHGAIHEWAGWNLNSMVVYKHQLYGGSSTGSSVYKLLTGTSDNGTAISATWTTGESFLGIADFMKWMKRIVVTLKNGASATVSVSYSIDRGAFVTRTIVTTQSGTINQAELILPAGTRGRIIQMKVSDATLNESFEVYGLTVDYEALPGRIL